MYNSLETEIINNFNNTKKVVSNLRKFGKIDKNASYQIFFKCLEHSSRDVRLETIKNLGKLEGQNVIETLINHYKNEKDSLVRRECVSSLGRQRDETLITFFSDVLTEEDPKIILQGIRALLVFKKNQNVIYLLESLKEHPNEMIQDVLEIELNKQKKEFKYPHTYVSKNLENTIVNGDVLETLKLIDEDSIHLTFTSPPYYNARDYSFYSSYDEYLKFLRNVFKEVHRVTKNGRFLIVNTSPVIVPRVSRSHSSRRYPIPFDIHGFLVQDGWDFIDDIIWKKPETSVKNRIGGFLQHRKPLGYKPNCTTEYLMVYRRKTSDLIDWNIKQYNNEIIEDSKINDFFETTNVWEIDPTFDKTHSAVFPKELCERVIKYYSYKNDLVFDPFAGSGTFAETALINQRKFFSTEINIEYFNRIKEKLSKYDTNKNFLSLKEFKDKLGFLIND